MPSLFSYPSIYKYIHTGVYVQSFDSYKENLKAKKAYWLINQKCNLIEWSDTIKTIFFYIILNFISLKN